MPFHLVELPSHLLIKGDIYTVPVNGGKAAQITTNAAHDTHPVWSPDGKQIAFASDRMGSMDIFVVDREGGIPKRLTTHSGNETPVAFKDADHILFLANVMPSAEDAQFPSGQFQQVYEVSTTGDRPVMFSSMPMEDISINKTGNVYSTMIKRLQKIPGSSITLLLSHATSGCVHWTENAAIAS